MSTICKYINCRSTAQAWNATATMRLQTGVHYQGLRVGKRQITCYQQKWLSEHGERVEGIVDLELHVVLRNQVGLLQDQYWAASGVQVCVPGRQQTTPYE
jgi:hypothetical protein